MVGDRCKLQLAFRDIELDLDGEIVRTTGTEIAFRFLHSDTEEAPQAPLFFVYAQLRRQWLERRVYTP